MTDEFCHDHLNDEYAELCRQLAARLALKRPSPLLSGKSVTWACGIVRTIGWVNYLDDNPFVRMLEVDGMVMDVRHAPREVQKMAFEMGLIPYVPTARQKVDDD